MERWRFGSTFRASKEYGRFACAVSAGSMTRGGECLSKSREGLLLTVLASRVAILARGSLPLVRQSRAYWTPFIHN
jgi:hypothetical protein